MAHGPRVGTCPPSPDQGGSWNFHKLGEFFAPMHWRQPRRGCRGHIPQYFGWGTSRGISHPILLRTFGYSRPILVALRSLSLKPIPFGYKTPPIRFSQAGGQSAHKARPPTLNSRWRHCPYEWPNHLVHYQIISSSLELRTAYLISFISMP